MHCETLSQIFSHLRSISPIALSNLMMAWSIMYGSMLKFRESSLSLSFLSQISITSSNTSANVTILSISLRELVMRQAGMQLEMMTSRFSGSSLSEIMYLSTPTRSLNFQLFSSFSQKVQTSSQCISWTLRLLQHCRISLICCSLEDMVHPNLTKITLPLMGSISPLQALIYILVQFLESFNSVVLVSVELVTVTPLKRLKMMANLREMMGQDSLYFILFISLKKGGPSSASPIFSFSYKVMKILSSRFFKLWMFSFMSSYSFLKIVWMICFSASIVSRQNWTISSFCTKIGSSMAFSHFILKMQCSVRGRQYEAVRNQQGLKLGLF